jgi:hypothetical protein
MYVCVTFFSFRFISTGVWNYRFRFARQAFYHLMRDSNPFPSYKFGEHILPFLGISLCFYSILPGPRSSNRKLPTVAGMAGSDTMDSHFLFNWGLAKIFSLTDLEWASSWCQHATHIDVRVAHFGHFSIKQIAQYCLHTGNILPISLNIFEQHFIFLSSSPTALWNIFCQIISQHLEYGNWTCDSVSINLPCD